MTLATFLSNYGYLALLIGTFLEGETILVLGGLAAHQGYLSLTGVVTAAFVGSLLGDQLFFYLGRRHSRYILDRRPQWHTRIDRVHRLMARYETIMILGFRFLYGLRTVTPFVLGMSKVNTTKFMMLNAAGALSWAVAFGLGGYFFGHVLQSALGEIQHYEGIVLLGVAGIGALVWGYHFIRHRRRNRSGAP